VKKIPLALFAKAASKRQITRDIAFNSSETSEGAVTAEILKPGTLTIFALTTKAMAINRERTYLKTYRQISKGHQTRYLRGSALN